MPGAEDGGWAELSRTAELEVEPPRHPVRRRWFTAITILVVAAILVVGGAFLAESVARGFTEDAVAAAVQANLPTNVDGTVDVDIDGDWVILQLLSGRMEEVTISSDDARFDGIPIASIAVTASGVPIDLKSAVDTIDASVSLDQAALNEMLTMPGNDPELVLGDGTVSYEDSTSLLGFNVGYIIRASLEADGTDLLLFPEGAELTSDIGTVDASRVLDSLLGTEPGRLCAASRLPAGVTISRILVTQGAGTLELAASDFPLTGKALRTKGECPG